MLFRSDKKNRKKEKGGSLYRGRPQGAEGQHVCGDLGSQCTRRKEHTTEIAKLVRIFSGEGPFPRL